MLFQLYATGKYSFKTLRQAVTEAGLRTRPTQRRPAGSPISIRKIGDILRDRYYIGYVSHNDTEYNGRHEPLIDPELFARVQQVLYTDRNAGTRARKHDHYLKGTIWCYRCKQRFLYIKTRGKLGYQYPYFVCRGRQDHVCDMPILPAAEVEHAVGRHYATLRIPRQRIARLKTAMADTVADDQHSAELMRRHLRQERKRLDDLEDQYLELVDDPDWPREKLTTKIRAVQRDRDRIDAELAATDTSQLEQGRQALTSLLDLLEDPERIYTVADDQARRALTKACFSKLWIESNYDQPHVAESGLTDLIPHPRRNKKRHPTKRDAAHHATALPHAPKGQGLSKSQMVELRGLEPLTPTLPVWCATSCATAPAPAASGEHWASVHTCTQSVSGVSAVQLTPYGAGRERLAVDVDVVVRRVHQDVQAKLPADGGACRTGACGRGHQGHHDRAGRAGRGTVDVGGGHVVDVGHREGVADLGLPGVDLKHGGAGAVRVARVGHLLGAVQLGGQWATSVVGGRGPGQRAGERRPDQRRGQRSAENHSPSGTHTVHLRIRPPTGIPLEYGTAPPRDCPTGGFWPPGGTDAARRPPGSGRQFTEGSAG